MDVLMLPSRLLPATALDGLAHAVRRHGVHARVASANGDTDPAAVVTRWAAEADPGSHLVAHSNAGFLAPNVRAAVPGGGRIVFMDAALPRAVGTTALAPSAMRNQLGAMADPATGLLPPWTRWWGRGDLADVIPADDFAALDALCPQVPLAWFDSRIQPPTGWAEHACAYLAFGDTYAAEIAFARAHDWPVEVIEGRHLHFLWRPDEVAARLHTLLTV